MNIRKFLNINKLTLLAIGLLGSITECGRDLNLEEATIKKWSNVRKAEIEKEIKGIESLINNATKKRKRHLALRAEKEIAILRKTPLGRIHADIGTKIKELEEGVQHFKNSNFTAKIELLQQQNEMLLLAENLSQEINAAKTLEQANDVLQKVDDAINKVNRLNLTQQQKDDFKFTLMLDIQNKAKHLTPIAPMRKKRRLS